MVLFEEKVVKFVLVVDGQLIEATSCDAKFTLSLHLHGLFQLLLVLESALTVLLN